MEDTRRRLEQLALITLCVLLALSCLLILMPFFSAILWALILALATWPGLEWIENRTRLSRSLASLILCSVFFLAFIAPLTILTWNLADNVSQLVASVSDIFEKGSPYAPRWVSKLPFIGPNISHHWAEMFGSTAKLMESGKQLLAPAKDILLAGGSFLGQALFHFVISLFVLFFIYRDGETFFERIQVGASKIIGDKSRHLISVASSTLRSAIYGIVGTAVAQAILAGFGFLIAGVKAPLLLAGFTLVLSPIPFGPPLIWLGATIWLYHHGDSGWALFMLLWGGLVVSSVDNFVKPYIMSRGSNLPLVLVLLGILGGAFAFGALGIFLGPALLAVAYTVLKEWSETKEGAIITDQSSA